MNYIDRLLEKVNKGEIDKNEMSKRLTRKYRHRPVSDLIFEEYESEDFHFGKVLPYDSDKDVKDLLYDFMTVHTYDNGLPLTGLNYPPENPVEEHDYFEHYDRDQDREETGLYDEIEKVVYDEDEDEFDIIVNVTRVEYESDWLESYQGSSYEHDFG